MFNTQLSLHEHMGKAVDRVLRASTAKSSMDNITCVMAAFKGMSRRLNTYQKEF